MNFGAIGWFIAHEITHGNIPMAPTVLSDVNECLSFVLVFPIGFDDEGRQFDSNGNVENWWHEDTITEFTAKAKCFIDQVHFYLRKLKKKLLILKHLFDFSCSIHIIGIPH